jgi:hypothetical protein
MRISAALFRLRQLRRDKPGLQFIIKQVTWGRASLALG